MVSSSELQLIVSLSQAIFSLGLLVVTGVYTYYTRKQSTATQEQIDAMESQTEATAKPFLKATIERPSPVECQFVIQNTGNGAAHNVSASWGVRSEDETDKWDIPLIASGDKHKFYLRDPDTGESLPTSRDIKNTFGGKETELKFNACCEDIFEESHDFDEVLSLEDAIWGREENSTDLLERPPEETIAEGVESISNNLEDVGNVATTLRRELSSILQAHHAEQRVRHLERFGEMSVDQLARLSPEDGHMVRTKIRDLAEQGILEYDEETDVVRFADSPQKTSN